MTSFQLSTGCCVHLSLSSYNDDRHWKEYVVQFLSVKKVTRVNDERYRLIISDGTHFIQGILATQCHALVETKKIQDYTVAVIERWTSNTVQHKRLVILLSLRVLGNPKERIGEPRSLEYIVDDARTEHLSVVASQEDRTSACDQQHCHSQSDDQRGTKSDTCIKPIIPINELNPYQINWMIKARVAQKSDLKTWTRETIEGKVFSVTLLDESGEIRATAFNTMADELFFRLEEGRMYYISKADLKKASKKFSKSDYELTLERNTVIQECHDSEILPLMRFEFIPFDQLESTEKDTLCDVIGIIRDVGVISDVVTRQGNRIVKKKDITLVDDTSCSVQITLWGKQAESFNAVQDTIVAFKGVRVGDFGGVSLSTMDSTFIEIDPSVGECSKIRHWYEAQGLRSTFRAMTITAGGRVFNRAEATNLSGVKESKIGTGARPDFFSIQGTVVHIQGENLYYPSCTAANCLKKVTMENDFWHCSKCGVRAEAPEYRYMMSMTVADWSDRAYLTGWNDTGIAIFEMSANDLHKIKTQDEDRYNEIIHQANCRTYNFSCRARNDTFEDRMRVRYEVVHVDPIDYHEEASYMLELLRSPQWGQATAG